MITLLRRQSLAHNKDNLEKEFADVAKYLHEDFSDVDILRRIERIIKPYSDTMNIEFANKKSEKDAMSGLTSVRTVHVGLQTTYNGLQEIIKALEEEDVANRIVNFSCGSYNNESLRTSRQEMSVNLSIDFLVR